MPIRPLTALLLLGALGLPLSGCVFAAGAVAGAVVATEVEETDGEFDPLENTAVGRAIY